MAQMLPMIQVVPEMNFALDPVTGIIGSSLGSGVVLLSMDEVNEQVAKVELAADELMASLDPYTSPVGSFPKGRFLYYCRNVNKHGIWILISIFNNICRITTFKSIGGIIDG